MIALAHRAALIEQLARWIFCVGVLSLSAQATATAAHIARESCDSLRNHIDETSAIANDLIRLLGTREHLEALIHRRNFHSVLTVEIDDRLQKRWVERFNLHRRFKDCVCSGCAVDPIPTRLKDARVELLAPSRAICGPCCQRTDHRSAELFVHIAHSCAQFGGALEDALSIRRVRILHGLEEARHGFFDVGVSGLQREVETSLVIVEHRLDLAKLGWGETQFIDHRKEVDALARDATARKGLLAGEEAIKRWPECKLLVLKNDLHACSKVLAQRGLARLPSLEFLEDFAHCSFKLCVDTRVGKRRRHLLLGLRHAILSQCAASVFSEFARGLCGLNVFLNVFPCGAHLVLTLRGHDRLHHVATDVGH